ncbi:MAG: MFS transporter [Fibrella sp.]|nr:MFS transporter [Armatimonadota bacterium]
MSEIAANNSNLIPDVPQANKGYADLLRSNPAFRNLWIGQAISQLGDALYYLVFLFMVEKVTGDPKMVGIAGVGQTLPFLLFSPYAGVVADRWNRKTIMLACDLLSGFALLLFAVYVFFDATPPAWTLIAAGAALSAINAFFSPAKGAAIPQLVSEERRDTANALSLATQNLLPMIGVALSGTLLAILYAISPAYFFLAAILLNAVSFFGSAVFIARLPRLVPVHEEDKAEPNALRDVRDGFVYLKKERVLWILLWLNLLVQIAMAPFMLVYIAVNKSWFGGGYGTLALCEVSFFVGVVACSVFVERIKIARPGMAFIAGVAGIGITVIFMAVSRNVWAFAWWNFVAGLAFPFVQLPMAAYIQKLVPENFQGRVNAAMTMTGMGVAPVSIGLGGLLLAAAGPTITIAIMGVAMTLAGLLGLADKSFRTAQTDAI